MECVDDFTPQGHRFGITRFYAESLELPNSYHTTNAKTMLRDVSHKIRLK